MRSTTLALPALLLLLTTGCAATVQYVPQPDLHVAVEDAEKARIYVMRTTAFGFAVPMGVSDGDRKVGQTGPRGYICWEREPGHVEVTGRSENKSTVEFEAKAGKSYYLLQQVHMGILFARNKMEKLRRSEGQERLAGCSPASVRTSSAQR